MAIDMKLFQSILLPVLALSAINSFAAPANNSAVLEDPFYKKGAVFRDAGAYQKAFDAWYPLAEYLDEAPIQLALADLLLRPNAKRLRSPVGREVLATQLILRAALKADPSALQLIVSASSAGTHGFVPDAASSGCWKAAASGHNDPFECLSVTTLRHVEAMPTCTHMVAIKTRKSYAIDGEGVAKICIQHGRYALMIPGLLPENIIRANESTYAKYGIEQILTGDAPAEGEFEFQQSFNETMEQSLMQMHGTGIGKQIGEEIERKLSKKK